MTPPSKYCGNCGQPVTIAVPAGDNREREVCSHCGAIHYVNPKLVVGCVVEHEGRILLCKRAIEPRYGYWTVPAGFMELGETLAEAAQRETQEEALVQVDPGVLFAMVDVVHAGQVHAFFTGTLREPGYGAGAETLETRWFRPEDIPWGELAFPSNRIALEQYLENRRTGQTRVHLSRAPRLRLS